MHQSPQSAALPGAIRQIGYVVRDLDKAMESWIALGVGPWHVMRGLPLDALHRGQPVKANVTLAVSNSGDVQIELIHQEDDTPSVYTEFLASGQEGYQQIAWWVDDLDTAVEATVAATGWPIVWSSDDATSPIRYVYLESPTGPAPVVEIMERSAASDGFAEMVRAASADWDGSRPVRTLGPDGKF
ncbi:VOC family protein [Streptomyces sp. NPDC002276]